MKGKEINYYFRRSLFFFGLLICLNAAKGAWFLPLGKCSSFEKCNLRQLSVDGRYVLGAKDQLPCFWDLGDRSEGICPDLVNAYKIKKIDKHFLALSPDASQILTRIEDKAYSIDPSKYFNLIDNSESWALSSSNNSELIVGSSGKQACMWHPDQGEKTYKLSFIDLTSIGFSYSLSSCATAITPDKTLVTGWAEGEDQTIGFYWTDLTGVQMIRPFLEQRCTYPLAISSDGSTIVGKSDGQAFKFRVPYFFEEIPDLDSLYIELGTLPGQKTSQAKAVTADGSIIVGESGAEAFIWTKEKGMQNLQEALICQYRLGKELKNWTIYLVNGISDDGLYLLGTGVNPKGEMQSFVAYLGE